MPERLERCDRVRHLRPRIRAYVALTLALGASLGWMIRIARVQQEATSAIERSGNRRVLFRPCCRDGRVIVWHRTFFARRQRRSAHLHGCGIGASRSRIGPIDRLLVTNDQGATKAGLSHVEQLSGLKHLSLGNTTLTDAWLTHAKGFSGLLSLDLGESNVTDVGLLELRRLSELQDLNLRRTGVTDAGLLRLQGALKAETAWTFPARLSATPDWPV